MRLNDNEQCSQSQMYSGPGNSGHGNTDIGSNAINGLVDIK